eukprot:3591441-Amphidinium_carterae.1
MPRINYTSVTGSTHDDDNASDNRRNDFCGRVVEGQILLVVLPTSGSIHRLSALRPDKATNHSSRDGHCDFRSWSPHFALRFRESFYIHLPDFGQ